MERATHSIGAAPATGPEPFRFVAPRPFPKPRAGAGSA